MVKSKFESNLIYSNVLRGYIINETSNILTMSRCMTKKEKQISIFELFQFENELEFYKQSHTIATTILNIQIQQEQTSTQYHIHILFIGIILLFLNEFK
ncbi:unnamed protein product [Adineta steineri]|uniref:Uncharacterized protein n=1 Tax=Adineta steineri TaxID=433720 RepID=A0A820NSD8_9BILA|nr:unnamed protein product [Adineta steineri]